MGWTITLPASAQTPGLEAGESDFDSGEWAQIYALVNAALPHDEDTLDPRHCPLCRNAFVTVTTLKVSDLPFELVAGLVRGLPVAEVRALITSEPD